MFDIRSDKSLLGKKALSHIGFSVYVVMMRPRKTHRSRPNISWMPLYYMQRCGRGGPVFKKYFFKNRKQFAGTSRSSVRTIERCQVLPRDRYLTVMHVRIPLGGNIRTEPSFAESATLPKIHHIKSRGFSQRGFFLLRLLPDYQILSTR